MTLPGGRPRILLVLLLLYVLNDILLTPPAGLETRPPSLVTTLGLATLGLLFVGLALSIVSIILLFYKPRYSPTLAIAAGIFFLPAFITEQASAFSSLRPPTAIEAVEIVQAGVSLITIFVALTVHQQKTA